MPHFTELIDALPSSMIGHRALVIACDKKQGEGTDDERRAEWLPLYFVPNHHDGDLVPFMSRGGEDPAKVLETNLSATTPAQWQALAARTSRVRSPLLSAFYLDFLWRTKKSHGFSRPYEFARTAMERYATAVRERLGNGEDIWEAFTACRQLGRLARELNDPGQAVVAARLAGEIVDAVRKDWARAPGFPLSGARAVLSIVTSFPATKRPGELLAEVESTLARLDEYMPAGSPIEATPVGRDVFKLRAQLEEACGKDTVRQRSLERAASMVSDAEARSSAGEHLVAGGIMTDAIALYTELGERERAAECKRRAREMFVQGEAGLKPIVTTVTIPAAPLRAWIEWAAAQPSLLDVIRCAVGSGSVIPSWAETTAVAAESAKTAVLAAMMPTVTLVDGRPAVRARDGTSELLRRDWLMRIRMGVHMHWSPLIEKLKADGRVSPGLLLAELDKTQILPSHNRSAMERALRGVLEGDHLVACHMLPALVESALRTVFSRAGIDTSAFRPADGGKVQERTMGALFDDEVSAELAVRARQLLGDDLWNWYRTVLFEEAGPNLRNRAAHGLLRDDECNRDTSETLLLALAALVVVEPRSASEQKPT